VNPTLTWLTFLAAATVLRFGPGALMSLLDWLARPIADVGPEDWNLPPLDVAWLDAFGAQCDAEMREGAE